MGGGGVGHWWQGGQGTDLQASEVKQSNSKTLGTGMNFSQLIPVQGNSHVEKENATKDVD